MIVQRQKDYDIQHYSDDYLIKDATINLFILNFNLTPFVEEQIQRSKLITPFKYQGKFGIIDKDLVLKVPVALDDIDVDYTYSGQGMERVQYDNKYGYVSPVTGELLIPYLRGKH